MAKKHPKPKPDKPDRKTVQLAIDTFAKCVYFCALGFAPCALPYLHAADFSDNCRNMKHLQDLPELSGRALWSQLVDSGAFAQANDLVFSPEGFLLVPCWCLVGGRPSVEQVKYLDVRDLSRGELHQLLNAARLSLRQQRQQKRD